LTPAAPGFSAAVERALVAKFLLRVPGADVRIERVGAIPRGPNGKFAFFVTEPTSVRTGGKS
jgi:phenylacetate-CoA ligase